MRIKITSMLAAGLLSLPLVALAADTTPKMGSTKDTVRSQFGAPVKQIPGVGTPSISRWEYQDFTVYFENDRTLHAVRHATALAQPPAAQPVDTLPPIEEISNESDAAHAPVTPAADTTAEQPAAETESAFRFDPVSGRIIEVSADGKAIQSPAAQPLPAAPVEAEAPAPAAEPDAAAEPEVTSEEDLSKEKAAAAAAAAAASEAAAKAPAAPAPATPAPAPAAEPGQPQFRFDPVSGRIVVDDPDAKAAAAPEQAKEVAPTQVEPAPEVEAAPSEAPEQAPAPERESTADAQPKPQPEPEPKAEKKEEESSGGFSVDWGA